MTRLTYYVREIDDLVEKLTKAEAENKVLNDLIKSSQCSESDLSWTDIEDEELSSCEDCAAKFETKTSLKTHKKMFPAFCYKCELWLNDGKQLLRCIGANFDYEVVEDPEVWMIFTCYPEGGFENTHN